MNLKDREKTLDEILYKMKKYLNAARGLRYEPSIYEWRRLDNIEDTLKEIRKIENNK